MHVVHTSIMNRPWYVDFAWCRINEDGTEQTYHAQHRVRADYAEKAIQRAADEFAQANRITTWQARDLAVGVGLVVTIAEAAAGANDSIHYGVVTT